MASPKNDTFPTYIFLFPLFFVFHGFVENFPFISVSSAVLLVALYTSFLFLFWGILFLLSKDIIVSALTSSFIIGFHFFFGAIHDVFKGWAPDSFITKYSFIIISFIVLTCLILFFLRKVKPDLSSFTKYCNLLFPLLFLVDLAILIYSLSSSATHRETSKEYSVCSACKKPDIYVILLDGYAGEEQLEKDFNFNNSHFLNGLTQKGFKIIPSTRSNYNFTPFSTASTLNMEYFDTTITLNNAKDGNHLIMQKLHKNRFVSFLRANGYTFYNYSIFNIDGQASPVADAFVPSNISLITANTFISRFKKEVLLNIAQKLHLQNMVSGILSTTDLNNKKIYELTVKKSGELTQEPKVVYTHLLMPHHPYFYTETGMLKKFESTDDVRIDDKEAYLGYLKYTNKEITRLVDSILEKSHTPPVIALLSDHGFRYTGEDKPKYQFSNLLSIYLPSHNYSAYTDSLTNVNFLRVFLNTEFKQNLPMLKNEFFCIDF